MSQEVGAFLEKKFLCGKVCLFANINWLEKTWANNSTGDRYSSITCQLDNNLCKYTLQINGHYNLTNNSVICVYILLCVTLDGWSSILCFQWNLLITRYLFIILYRLIYFQPNIIYSRRNINTIVWWLKIDKVGLYNSMVHARTSRRSTCR